MVTHKDETHVKRSRDKSTRESCPKGVIRERGMSISSCESIGIPSASSLQTLECFWCEREFDRAFDLSRHICQTLTSYDSKVIRIEDFSFLKTPDFAQHAPVRNFKKSRSSDVKSLLTLLAHAESFVPSDSRMFSSIDQDIGTILNDDLSLTTCETCSNRFSSWRDLQCHLHLKHGYRDNWFILSSLF